jgi:hypothetical protein
VKSKEKMEKKTKYREFTSLHHCVSRQKYILRHKSDGLRAVSELVELEVSLGIRPV